MLNILFIVPSISESSKGIFKKQFYKITAFEKAGCIVKPILFTHEIKNSYDKETFQIPIDDTIIRNRYSKKIIWRFLPYLLARNSAKIIYENIKNNIKGIDYAYIRYSGADFHSLKLFKLLKNKKIKIIFEYNGHVYNDEVINFKSNMSVFTFYKYINEKYFQKKVARYANIIVGVTNELTEFYSKLNPLAVKYTLSNGVDISKFLKRNPINYDCDCIKFLFLSGSVNYWHGLDRFLNGLKQYTGSRKIELTIAGLVHAEYKKYNYINGNISVNFLNSLDGAELNTLFNDHHIGIGSLALHRMGLKEASVLKVREYIVRGMPFILGYKDTDLFNADDFKHFYFEVKPDESFLNIEDVLRFADRVLTIKNYSQKMSELGGPLVDYKPKIEGLVHLMEKLKNN